MLIKGGKVLDALGSCRTIAFDKTGAHVCKSDKRHQLASAPCQRAEQQHFLSFLDGVHRVRVVQAP